MRTHLAPRPWSPVAVLPSVSAEQSRPAPRTPEAPAPIARPHAPRRDATPAYALMTTFARYSAPVAAALAALTLGTATVAAREQPRPEAAVTCPADEEAMLRVKAAKQAPYGASARALAKQALSAKYRAAPDHPLMKHRAEVQRRLELLGLLRTSGDHLHISDVDLEHGGAVLRAAIGLNPLVKTVTSTLSVDGVPEPFAKKHLSAGQFARYRAQQPSEDAAPPEDGPVPTMTELIAGSLDELEVIVLEKQLRVQHLTAQRDQISQAKRIFVNMSFGQSPDRLATGMAEMIMTAPPGSALHALAEKTLGEKLVTPPDDMGFEEPTFSFCDASAPADPAPMDEDLGPPDAAAEAEFAKLEAQFAAIKKKLVYPALTKAMQRPEFQARMKQARDGLDRALVDARRVGILVFEAAGNEYADADRSGNPAMSMSMSTGAKHMLRIGALDLGRLGDPKDDRVAEFSAAGRVAVASQGTKLPVWFQLGHVEESEGTSFSSPLTAGVGVAVAAAAKDPNLTPDGIARLLVDPRAVHDIPGTTRDGAGALDDFAAVILAANPKLDRGTIDRAWQMLAAKDADVPAVKRLLGLAS